MPGKIKVKVLAGRNLPVMDRASDTTDAFVEIKFGGVTHKTDVCRKSLNPHWNSTEWYRFEVDESELQDEPLQLRLMDHDTYSANDAIGKVVISLAPLLARETAVPNKGAAAVSAGAVMSGWIPVFDTMHGIRGELNVIVKVELFSDFNKYKTSSCGVQFFHCPMIPPGYRATSVHGFVEELVVNDDPEYQWIDKIRTPRASNEARQVAFIKLSNQVQRLVGLKAAELGANAVVGYQQDFDLEGEAGVVARAIGTAVSISPLPTPSYPLNVPPCSQQQLKQYLDILSTDNENVGDLNHYFSTHQDELQKLVNILHPKYSSNFLDEGENPDDDDQSMHLQRQSSIKSYTDSISIYQDDFASQNSFKRLSEDQTDLNKLLNRIDQANDPNRNDSSDSDSSGPLQTIKKIKTNFFAKKLGRLRSRKNEKPSDDQVSIKSNSSDTSKISLTDIRNELKKFKRNLKPKKPKFRKPFKNMEDVGVGMASILARSVIHAHTSLACIAETQDSEASPSSTLRRTSESEPTINVIDEERVTPKIVTEVFDEMDETDPQKHVPEIRCASLLNINIECGDDKAIHRTRTISESCPTTPVASRTENFLTLPGEQGYFGSVSSALSGDSSDMYSSSEDDDESSDPSAERSIETTSSIVQTVLNQEVNPNVVAQMEKKLSVLEMASELDTGINDDVLKLETVNAPEIENNKNEQIEEASTSETFVTEKPINHHFKFHNPFTHKKSISAPSSPVEKKGSFVYRSSKRIRLQLTKLSKNKMIKSLSHYSLIPKKKRLETTTAMSQPGSSSDVPSKAPSHETVLGSPFLSYTDLMSLDKESADAIKSLYKSDELPRGKVQMYIGSEPASRASVSGPSSPYHGTSGLSSPFHGKDDYHFSEQRSQKRERKPSIKPTGLIHTAMETLLIDKVQSLLLPTSPEPNAKEKQFFDDVNQKLEIVEEAQKSFDKSDQKPEITDHKDKIDQNIDIFKENGLYKSGELPHSKEKMSIESKPVSQSVSRPYHSTKGISPPFHGKDDHHFSEQRSQQGEKKLSLKPTGLIHTAMETLLVDRVHSLLLPTTPEPDAKEKQPFDDVNKKLEIVEAAQKSNDTIDLEPQIIDNKDKVEQVNNIIKEKSLYKSDELPRCKIEMFLESEPVSRASVSVPSSPCHGSGGLSSPFHGKDYYHSNEQKPQSREKIPSMKPTGLIHTAMETLLIDKVQSLLLPSSPESKAKEKQFFDDENQKLQIVDAAQKSIDKIDPKPEIIDNKDSPYYGKDYYHPSEPRPQKRERIPSVKPTGLIHTAMETLLIDKVQSLLLPASPEPNAKEKQFFDDDNQKFEIVDVAQKSFDKIDPKPQIIDNKDKVQENIEILEEKSLFKGEEPPRSKDMYIGSEPVSRASGSGPSSPYHGTSSLSSPFHKKDDYHSSELRSQKREKKPTGLIHAAMETLLIDKVQSLLLPTSPEPNAKETQFFKDVNKKLEIVEEAQKSIDNNNQKPKIIDDKHKVTQKNKIVEDGELKPLTLQEKEPQTEIINEKDQKNNGKKLIRQDSIHSQTESPSWSRKMSKEIEPNLVIPCKTIIQCTPVLQNFHPILSGSLRPLETIPSLPESASIDRPQSLDIDGLPDDTSAISISSDQCSASTNCVSVCDNTHAACRAIVGRSERDKEIKDKEKDKGSPKHTRHESYNKDSLSATSGGAVQNSSLNATSTPVGMHRRSSDSDLSVTPKGSSLNASGNAGSGGGAILRPSMNSNNLDLLEYPFLTMTEYPPGFIVHLGGCVCARSVKLVDGGGESAARAAWWAELRTELRAHTRALRCNAVIAYTETTAICEDVCVLSASGTAAVINLDCDFNADIDAAVTVHNGSKTTIEEVETQSTEYCGIAHVPYSPGPGPHGADLSHCGGCRRARVPSVLLATCAKPNRLTSYAKAVTLTAVAARVRRAPPQAEPGARDISDQLPFLEYELHKLLLAKLRMQGANALFNLQTQIAIGERCVMALATGTAVRLGALPPPTPPRIKASENDKDALEMQRALWDTFTANKTANGYDHIPELGPAGVVSVTETEERPVLELCADKDAALLELDEAEDVETARFLAARRTHMQVYCNGMKTAPGKPPQAFAQVWRARLNLTMQGGGATAAAERHVARALDGITYKLRRLRPCVLMAPRFQLELPEDEIQLVLSGAAIQLQDPNKPELNGYHDNANNNVASCHPSIIASVHAGSHTASHSGHGSSHGQGGAGDVDDDIFTLDEEQASPPRVPVTTEVVEENKPVSNGPQQPMAVSLTSVSHISTGRCARRVCALRLLFVRETTAVRELGGLSGFLHTFTAEVMAIVRAYTAALGGNALTSFYITQLMLQDNAHKNQGQCLLSVGGDVVQIMY